MDKIICIVIIIAITGCRGDENKKTYQDFQAQGFNLVLGNDFVDVQYNLENDSLKAWLLPDNNFYKDTMHLSIDEKNEIASRFFEQNIDECYGHTNVDGRNFSFPRVDNGIHLYIHKKEIATLSVIKDYEPEGIFTDKREKSIVKFRDSVWKILNKKSKFKVAQDSLRSLLRKNPIPLM